jgi:1-acyl-sn-glycerol-3-phosphate acyltransferase
MKHYHAEVKRISNDITAFFRRTFTRVDIQGPKIDPALFRDSSLMVACTHRSQTDYFVVGYVLHCMGIENMRFAAGENLTNLPIIGPMFRNFGAFTVRRGTTFGRDYVRNLCEQVVTMLHDGDTIVVFPEGGRSYEGQMLEVRGGIIGSSVLARRRNPARKVYLLPMSISYEFLPELHAFDSLLKGKSMRRAGQGWLNQAAGSLRYYGADALAFLKFLNAHHFGVKYGAVHVDHGEPVLVDSLYDPARDISENSRDEFSACRLAFQNMSLRVFDLFHGLYRILPQHIVASVVSKQPGIDTVRAEQRCVQEMQRLREAGRNVSLVENLSPPHLLAEGVRQLTRLKALTVREGKLRVRLKQVMRYCAAATE